MDNGISLSGPIKSLHCEFWELSPHNLFSIVSLHNMTPHGLTNVEICTLFLTTVQNFILLKILSRSKETP